MKAWINDGPYTARRTHEVGLIDAVQHREDFEAGVKQRFDGNVRFDYKYGQKAGTKSISRRRSGIINFYAQLLAGKRSSRIKTRSPSCTSKARSCWAAPRVACSIQAANRGEHADPPGDRSAAADDSIKAVVLRVNSPGGSATASEIILDATKRVKAKSH